MGLRGGGSNCVHKLHCVGSAEGKSNYHQSYCISSVCMMHSLFKFSKRDTPWYFMALGVYKLISNSLLSQLQIIKCTLHQGAPVHACQME